jgi:F-type H+-transporting ATPase subunit gamma
MAQLINMRQRIKAIETIKKITHAMRLISMSTHSQLKHKQDALQQYKKAITSIASTVENIDDQHISQNSNSKKHAHHEYVLLIGSEKGLCGNFNVQLFKYFEKQHQLKKPIHAIAVGKYAIDFLEQHNAHIHKSFKSFDINNFVSIAHDIADYIIDNNDLISSVTAYHNVSRSFFLQKPSHYLIYPLKDESQQDTGMSRKNASEYIIEQPLSELFKKLQDLSLKTSLQNTLYNSLLSEQAARFVSMDSSTRNADSLLQAMKLEYNKERQTSITKELTELVGSFL